MTAGASPRRAPLVDVHAPTPAGDPIVHGPWPVGIVGLVAARLAEDRGRPAVVGADLGDVDPRVVPQRRVDRPRRRARAAAATCSRGTAATPAPPASSSPAERWDAFAERFLALAAADRAADPRVPLRDRPRVPALDVDYAPVPRARRPGAVRSGQPGPARRRPRPDRDPRPAADRRPHPAHPAPRPRRPRRDRLRPAPTSPSSSARATGSTSSRGSSAGRFGGFESLQLEIRDAAPSGSHPKPAAILGARRGAPAPPLAGSAHDAAPPRPRPRGAGDPYGVGPVGS